MLYKGIRIDALSAWEFLTSFFQEMPQNHKHIFEVSCLIVLRHCRKTSLLYKANALAAISFQEQEATQSSQDRQSEQ